MAGADFDDTVHGMLDSFREQSEREWKWLEALEGFKADFAEGAKAFHGNCGQILFEEAKKNRLTEETFMYDTEFPPIDMSGDRYDAWNIALENYLHLNWIYGIGHEETRYLPVHVPDSEGGEMGLSLRVHRFRPMIPTRPPLLPANITPNLNEAIYVADIAMLEDDGPVVNAVDVGYEISSKRLVYFTGPYKHQMQLIPESMRPILLTALEGTNAVLETAIQQNYTAQTTSGS